MKTYVALFIFIFILAFFIFAGFSGVTAQASPTVAPQSTRMVILNQATAAALSPPTITPTLIPQSFDVGGEYDKISSIWVRRIITIISFLFVSWLVYIVKEIKIYEKGIEKEIRLAEIAALSKMSVDPRPITSVTITGGGEKIRLHNKEEVSKKKIIRFVSESVGGGELGLSISRWKSIEGWSQCDIENILDHLAHSRLITERAQGKTCEWTTTPRKNVLAHIFRLNIGDVE